MIVFDIDICLGSLKLSDFWWWWELLNILLGKMSMIRNLQHGNLPINGLSPKLSKFPPLPEIRQFEGPYNVVRSDCYILTKQINALKKSLTVRSVNRRKMSVFPHWFSLIVTYIAKV